MDDSPSTPQAAERTGTSSALIVMAAIPIIGLVLAIGVLLANNSAATTPQSTSVPAVVGSVGQIVPEIPLTDLDGQPLDLAQYRGRPVFVNFWGTWCEPCIRELPEMQAFAASQGDDGAVVVAANSSESPETIRAFFDKNDFALTDIIFAQDAENVLYRWFGVWQMPTTYLVDADGVVRAFKYGAFNDASELQAYLDNLAAQ